MNKKLSLILSGIGLITLSLVSCNQSSNSPSNGLSPNQEDLAVDPSYGLELDIMADGLPLGYVYIQYPTSPNKDFITMNPCELGYTGRWFALSDYDGAFFRTDGGLGNSALPFNVRNKFNPQSSLAQPLQLDAFQGHHHDHKHNYSYPHGHKSVGPHQTDKHEGSSAGARGIWGGNTNLSLDFSTTTENPAQVDNGTTHYGYLSDLTSKPGETGLPSTYRVAYETRPKNYTMRMWTKVSVAAGDLACDTNIDSYTATTTKKKLITKDSSGNVLSEEWVIDKIETKPMLSADGKRLYHVDTQITFAERAKMLEQRKLEMAQFMEQRLESTAMPEHLTINSDIVEVQVLH